MNIADLKAKIASSHQDALVELCQFVAQPSLSVTGEGIPECAVLLAKMMQDRGISSQIMETAGQPVVYGHYLVDPNAPTLLIYGHYDVQPVEPLEDWLSHPFTPTIRDGKLYARGVGDNKGQLFAHLLALQYLTELEKAPKANLKFLFEGEEEVGSPNLVPFVEAHKELLKADAAYYSDGPIAESGAQTVNLGVRGILTLELKLKGAKSDLHSGNHGGVAPMPAWEMVHLLASLVDPETGLCTIPGFYDAVRPIGKEEQNVIEALKEDQQQYMKNWQLNRMGVGALKRGFHQSLMLWPTFNINGLQSGYTGAGIKTIIPAEALAKIDIRMVADQDPEQIYSLVVDAIKKANPNVEVRKGDSGYPAAREAVDHPFSKLVIDATSMVLAPELPQVQLCLGGSAPNFVFTKHLGLPCVAVPIANADEANHAPNENLDLECFKRGIAISAAVMKAMENYKA